MDWEQGTQEIKPEDLPFYSSWPEYSFGEIVFSEFMCPGVYYLRTERQEYYAVQSGSKAISKEAKAYGAAVPDCPDVLLFDHLKIKSGKEIIEYEVESTLSKPRSFETVLQRRSGDGSHRAAPGSSFVQ